MVAERTREVVNDSQAPSRRGERIVLPVSRAKMLLCAVGAALMAIGSGYAIRLAWSDGDARVWACVVGVPFFGYCAVMAVLRAVRRAYLIIDDVGIKWKDP